ncbi:MAG: hypothetical protein HC892_16530 [Saprospiraceae bacterium]|nr:hypothetical protein [Saprospiraceae bacterium]
MNWETLNVNFELAQVPILRAGIHEHFLTSKYWRFHPTASAIGSAELLSDGKIPPSGQMVAYPTTLIFARNITVKFETYSGNYNYFDQKIKGGGGLSLFGLHLGGRYENARTEKNAESHFEGQGISVPGMQLIGFRCHLLPKSPDPLKVDEKKWA